MAKKEYHFNVRSTRSASKPTAASGVLTLCPQGILFTFR